MPFPAVSLGIAEVCDSDQKSRPKAAKVRAYQRLEHRWYPGRPEIVGGIDFAKGLFQ